MKRNAGSEVLFAETELLIRQPMSSRVSGPPFPQGDDGNEASLTHRPPRSKPPAKQWRNACSRICFRFKAASRW